MEAEASLDKIGWQLLRVLQEDARLSYSELGRRVGLSSPAVAERVRRMEDTGIISHYRALVDPSKLGYPVLAFVTLRTGSEHYNRVATIAHTYSEILECHHVTGEDAFLLKVIVSSLTHLEHIVGNLRQYGETTTQVVLSSPVKGKMVLSDPSVRISR